MVYRESSSFSGERKGDTVMAESWKRELWDKRWCSIHEVVKEWIKRYPAPPAPPAPPGFPRQQTIHCLLTRLREFAESQVGWLMTRADAGKYDPAYPPSHALYVTLAQIEYDLEVICRAAEYRKHGTADEKAALRAADKLAWAALSPVLNVGGARVRIEDGPELLPLLDETATEITVLTYFAKSANIRVIPYAPVALVGIPITCVPKTDDAGNVQCCSPQDYLAIPHEVGHFVYGHSPIVRKRILWGLWGTAIFSNVRLFAYFTWLEEIFADLYGCLIAGAWAALDCQHLQLKASKSQFVQNDLEHPIPAVRPYVYTWVLRKLMDQDWNAEALETYWDCMLFTRGNPQSLERAKPVLPNDTLWQRIHRAFWELLPGVLPDDAKERAHGVLEWIVQIFPKQVHLSRAPDKGLQVQAWNDIRGLWPIPQPEAGDTVTEPQNGDTIGAESPECQAVSAKLDGKPYDSLLVYIQDLLASNERFPAERELKCDNVGVPWADWQTGLATTPLLPKNPLDLVELGKRFRKIPESLGLLEQEIDASQAPDSGPTQEEMDEWISVLHAEGWTTKGPHSDWHR